MEEKFGDHSSNLDFYVLCSLSFSKTLKWAIYEMFSKSYQVYLTTIDYSEIQFMAEWETIGRKVWGSFINL